MQHLTLVPAGRRAARRRLRFLPLLAAALLVASVPGAAAAAVPVNDAPGQAIAFTSIPQVIDVDTTQATVVGDDIGCGSGGQDRASVWYRLTLPATTQVVVDARATGSPIGINVFAGSATSSALVLCVEDALIFEATAGTTYYVMFADIDGDATNGGLLQATIDVAPPPIDVSVTINAKAKFNTKTREATIGGTITCSAPASGFVSVDIRQPNGRFVTLGFGGSDVPCGPQPAAWWATVSGENGKLATGRPVTVLANASGCDGIQCGDAAATATVRLGR